MNPQQQHIKVTYQIRDMKDEVPLRGAPKSEHVAHLQKWLTIINEAERRNCRLRLIAEMFHYLADSATVLLESTKFRDAVIAKMKEMDEEVVRLGETYAIRKFYDAAEHLKYVLESSILRKYHVIQLKGRPYY
jgi:hypothetical protein